MLAVKLSGFKLLATEGFQVHTCRLAIQEATWHRLHPLSHHVCDVTVMWMQQGTIENGNTMDSKKHPDCAG